MKLRYLLVGLLAACTTTGTIRSMPIDQGTARTYSASLTKVLAASRDAMVGTGISIQEATEVEPGKTWMILGKKGMSTFSYGELIRVVVTKQATRQTEVRVVTKRRGKLNVFAKGDYSTAILDQVALRLTS